MFVLLHKCRDLRIKLGLEGEALLCNKDIVSDGAGVVEGEIITRCIEGFDLEMGGGR